MLGFVVGLAAEGRIASRYGFAVCAGGGTAAGAAVAAGRLVDEGATALVSFGLAGGLDPVLRPGVVIVPSVVVWEGAWWFADVSLAARFGGFTGHRILGGAEVVVSASEKRELFRAARAHAVDLESGAVAAVAARSGLPFVVVRAICDPAERELPPAALIALNGGGGIGLLAVLRSVAGRPRQVSALLALAGDAWLARRALVRLMKQSRQLLEVA